jgi:hypothetical protein
LPELAATYCGLRVGAVVAAPHMRRAIPENSRKTHGGTVLIGIGSTAHAN